MNLEPKIIVFCCNWCSYAAADLAGAARIQYPHNIRIIRLMCAGMIHPRQVMDAFAKGADGVMVLGCRLGECHYQHGNSTALSRAEIIIELLGDLDVDRQRFAMDWLSSAESAKFAALVTEMTRRVKQLGLVESGNED